jgi:predicted helicase
MTKIHHAHLYGTRENKYQFLAENTALTTSFQEIQNQSPFYLLVPQDIDLFKEYEGCFKITDAMPINVLGFQTHRDDFAIDFEKENLYQRINELREDTISETDYLSKYKLKENSSWKLKNVRKAIREDENWDRKIINCLYRPFDWRSSYYSSDVMDRPRRELINHVANKNNLCLMAIRQMQDYVDYSHVLVSSVPAIDRSFACSRGAASVFPLWLYPDSDQPKELQQEKRANFSPEFLNKIENKLGYKPTSEEVFYYIYGVFHSPTYRSRYAEFLKIDFPRVPLTSNKQLFNQLADYGEQLTQLHLMTSPLLDAPLTKGGWGDLTYIDNGGSNIIEAGHPKYTNGSVKINKKGDEFSGVPEAIWNFYIGGYQVCHKWLKDRKERTLSDADITHYKKIIIALTETDKLMQKIDQAIPSFPIE